jgi:hypothetical protein
MRDVELLRVAIRVKPGSSRSVVGGVVGQELAVAITAQAHDGEANKAAIAALAKALGVPKSHLAIVKGATFRSKVVEISLVSQARAEVEREIRALRALTSHG